MSFIDYLSTQNINAETPGAAGIMFRILSAMKRNGIDIDYRNTSLAVIDVPGLYDLFNKLWYEYESELDRVNYERQY